MSVQSDATDANTATSTLVARTHKQQTTQQVTTVTKVIREVKHLGGNSTPVGGGGGKTSNIDGQPVDYIAMPMDVQHLNADGQPIDFVAMPLAMYPR